MSTKYFKTLFLTFNLFLGSLISDDFSDGPYGNLYFDTAGPFVVTDLNNEIIVSYSGTVPALFAEGKGVVAEGRLRDKKFFIAKRILAKHDENYMPPELRGNLNKDAK